MYGCGYEASQHVNNSCMYSHKCVYEPSQTLKQCYMSSYQCCEQCTHLHTMYTSAFFSVYLHSYHVEYTTDVGFPEEKTALAWSFRADLKQRSLLLRPGIDDGVPNSVPTHTVLRAHVVRSVCASFAFALVGFADSIVFSLCLHIHGVSFLCSVLPRVGIKIGRCPLRCGKSRGRATPCNSI